ncbi:MAG: 3-oxoacyl-[acyl-carrier-protein] reductase [Magnetococcales bacterium]|nr:3-oxoacyl-[acyl-carrier-protein] reductase [Magnetococcales bacterium]
MLNDQVALVTGSTGGIGRATALALARLGAQVVITSNEPDRIPEALEEVRHLAPRSIGIESDVTSTASLERLVQTTLEQFGRIDILVNNAGITRDNLLVRMKDEEWDQVLAVNLTSIFHLTRLVVKSMMKARYGRIVNVSSVVAALGNPGQANYVAAKAGLIGLTKTLAREVASRGVTVNCVAPGFIATRMTESLKAEVQQAMLAQIPMGVMGQPEDVAGVIAFLVSEQARYITGATIPVNGGMYMS